MAPVVNDQLLLHPLAGNNHNDIVDCVIIEEADDDRRMSGAMDLIFSSNVFV